MVRPALRHQLEHLALARRESLERIVAAVPPDELRDDERVQGRTALRHALDGRDELVDVGDAVLEEIAEPLGVLREQLDGVRMGDVLREDEDAGLGMLRPDLACGADALVGLDRKSVV